MIYRFGEFELDIDAGELRRNGEGLEVQAKPFLLLVYLVRNAHRPVTKREIFDSLWQDAAVSEASLRQLIKLIRRTLGDDGEQQRFLRTIRGRGYRFVAEVETFASGDSAENDALGQVEDALTGREEALVAIEHAVAEARAGHGRQIIFSGQAGQGKTRLLREVRRKAEADEFETFWANTPEVEQSSSYQLWREVLHLGVERFGGAAALQKVIGHAAGDLLLIDPRLEVSEDPADQGPTSSPSEDDAGFRLAESMSRLLRIAARERPILLIFDDIHAADLASLRLLAWIARASMNSRVLIAAGYRPFEAGQNEDRDRVIGELQRIEAGGSFRLENLTRSQTFDFLRSRYETEPSEEQLDSAYRRSGGNPFLLELGLSFLPPVPASAPASSSGATLDPTGRDSALEQGVLRLLQGCSQTTRQVLETGALIGRDFTIGLLLSASSFEREVVMRSLEEAEKAGLILARRNRPGTFRFIHMLVAECLEEMMPSPHRLDVHARLGAAYAALSDAPTETRQASIAYHYLRAGPELSPRSLPFSLEVARTATKRGAHDEAVFHLKQAVAVLRERSEGAAELRAALIELGEAQNRAHDTAGARASLRSAASLARSAKDDLHFARAALAYANETSIGSYQPESIEILEEGLQRLSVPDSDPAIYARLMGRLANARSLMDDPEQRAARAMESVSIARRSNDSAALAETLRDYHFCLMRTGSPAQRQEVADELYDLAVSLKSADLEMWALKYRIESALEAGVTKQIHANCRTFDKRANRHRVPFFLCHAMHHKAMLALREGRLSDVEALASGGLELGMRSGNQIAIQFFGVQMWSLRREQGRLAELEPQVEELIRNHPDDSGWVAALAYDRLGRGDAAHARTAFQSLVDSELPGVRRSTNWSTTPALLAEMAADFGDVERSRRLYSELEDHAEKNVIVSVSMADFGPVHRYLGLCASNFDHDRARRHLEKAISRAEHQNNAPALARAQIDLARLIKQENRSLATELAGRAHQAGTRMRAASIASKAEELIEL